MSELGGKDDTCLRAALNYLARGWSVVPVAERGKRPMVRWQTFEDRRPTEAEVRGWFERWPSSNIAVVTGAVSGLVVLDIDMQHGGEESLKRLALRNAGLPRSKQQLAGEGATSGKPYSWRKGQAPDEIALAPLPDWLLVSRFGGTMPGHPLSYWRTLVREGVSEGERNATIASFSGHLLWHGVDPEVTLELMLVWNRMRCRPPLDDEEVIRTVRSIERTHAKGRDDPSTAFY
jgi:hypothetical protein